MRFVGASAAVAKGLIEKHRRFVVAYTGEAQGNATQAAIIAGYSPKSARSQASELLTKPNIIAAVQERQERLTQKADLSDTRILQELAEVGYTKVEVNGQSKMKALELLAKHKGLLNEDTSSSNRVTVNIGFLQAAPTHTPKGITTTSSAGFIDAEQVAQLMPRPSHLGSTQDE
jgi:hypothetical protein